MSLHRKLVGKLIVSQILLKIVLICKSKSMDTTWQGFYVCFRNTTSCLTILNNFTSDPCISILAVESELYSKKYSWLKICWWKNNIFIIKFRKYVLGFFFPTRRSELFAWSQAQCYLIKFKHSCFGKSAVTYALYKCHT